MSLDHSVYIGPYFQVLTTPVKSTLDRCRQPRSCPQPTSGFCPTCGIKTKERFSESSRDPIVDFFHKMEDEGREDYLFGIRNKLEGEYQHLFMPNTWPKERCFLHLNAKADETAIDLKDNNPHPDMEKFRDFYQTEWELLRSMFGEKVSLCWGVLLYTI